MGRFVLKDTFFLKAKREGYRARSAYKLIEIQKRYNVLRRGDKALDLGCAPGGFLQVIREIVGDEGLVVGIDILDTRPFSERNVIIKKADLFDINVQDLMNELGISYFDVITSDISPNITGIKESDEENLKRVYEATKEIVTKALRKGGNLIYKSFFTEEFGKQRKDLSSIFKEVIVFKPQASRRTSSEIYLVCRKKIV
ncbi:MAG: SAM-dependent methyltransferase [Desulfobacterota bacterium]|nr:SAM-dependent methyltransferase [Thermodesulfobacteriota bacterium]MDW8001449.1 FtsJ-like methyltransferase family protein [Deltaproteobacteria bacterium]